MNTFWKIWTGLIIFNLIFSWACHRPLNGFFVLGLAIWVFCTVFDDGKPARRRYFVAYETKKLHGNISITMDGKLDNEKAIDEIRDFIRKNNNLPEGDNVLLTYWHEIEK